MKSNNIECPKCGHEFAVEEALSGKLQEQYEKQYKKKLQEELGKVNDKQKDLERQRQELEQFKAKQQEEISAQVKKQLATEKEKLRKEADSELLEQLKELQEENESRKGENAKLRKEQLSLKKRERELDEKREELELEVQQRLLDEQKMIEEKARAKEREGFELERRKLQKQIDDNKKLAEEMKRKAEQGSMQLQGEVQELALEELLRNTFPFDEIEEVPKGMRGADCIQRVVNASQQDCGCIIYESKRTKNFANDWIDKLKDDQVAAKADIAVIVTETMPSGMSRFSQYNGVWICGFHEVKSVSLVLREMLIKTASVTASQKNKGAKVELLYDYLTSNEFVQNIQRIVENYSAMHNQLDSEKRAMQRIWKEREKQIDVVKTNLSSLFGSIKGIAGKELETSGVLELPSVGDENN